MSYLRLGYLRSYRGSFIKHLHESPLRPSLGGTITITPFGSIFIRYSKWGLFVLVIRMLDPLTCIGLTGNIVQFLDFSIKIVSEGYQIYDSATGTTELNEDAEFVASDLVSIAERLGESLKPPGTNVVLNQNEQQLDNLRFKCAQIAHELIGKLEKLKIKGKKTFLKGLGKALRHAWSKDEIDKIQKRLENLREELEMRILVDIADTVDVMSIKQDEGFENLDLQIQAIVIALSENHTRTTDILEVQNRRIEVLQADTKKHVTEEHIKTRSNITSVQQEIIKHEDEIGPKSTELSMKIHNRVLGAEQSIIARDAAEHEKTREILKRQIEDKDHVLRACLDDFMKSWEAHSEAERKRFQERRKADFADLEAKRIVLSAIESSSPATSFRVTPYPAPHLPMPKSVPKRPRSSEMNRLVPEQRELGESVSDLPTRWTKEDQAIKSNNGNPLKRNDQRQLAVPNAPLGPPRPRSVSAIPSQFNSLIQPVLRQSLFVFIRISPHQPLIQLDVSTYLSDQEFFYNSRRGIRPRFNVTLEFGEFYVDDLLHIRVLGAGKAANPPPIRESSWIFSPRPMPVVPPVGSDTLTDYLGRPTNADKHEIRLLEKLPKSLRRIEDMLYYDKRVIWGLNVSSSWLPWSFRAAG